MFISSLKGFFKKQQHNTIYSGLENILRFLSIPSPQWLLALAPAPALT